MAEVRDVKDLLSLVGDVKAKMDTYAGKGSIIEYSQPARVEPIAMLDTRFIHLPYASDVMNTLVNIFAGYYLQAISLSTLKVGDVNVMHALQKFNPNTPLTRFFSTRAAALVLGTAGATGQQADGQQ